MPNAVGNAAGLYRVIYTIGGVIHSRKVSLTTADGVDAASLTTDVTQIIADAHGVATGDVSSVTITPLNLKTATLGDITTSGIVGGAGVDTDDAGENCGVTGGSGTGSGAGGVGSVTGGTPGATGTGGAANVTGGPGGTTSGAGGPANLIGGAGTAGN